MRVYFQLYWQNTPSHQFLFIPFYRACRSISLSDKSQVVGPGKKEQEKTKKKKSRRKKGDSPFLSFFKDFHNCFRI